MVAGALLGLLFNRLGLDPALMSAPFIATATDVAGVFIYLRTASWLLEHSTSWGLQGFLLF
jgi:magnesium transporter